MISFLTQCWHFDRSSLSSSESQIPLQYPETVEQFCFLNWLMAVFTKRFKHLTGCMIKNVLSIYKFCPGACIYNLSCLIGKSYIMMHLSVRDLFWIVWKVRRTSLDTVSAHVMCPKGNAEKLHSWHTAVQWRDFISHCSSLQHCWLHVHMYLLWVNTVILYGFMWRRNNRHPNHSAFITQQLHSIQNWIIVNLSSSLLHKYVQEVLNESTWGYEIITC